MCNEIKLLYEIFFLDIGSDDDRVAFLVHSAAVLSPKKVVNTIKA